MTTGVGRRHGSRESIYIVTVSRRLNLYLRVRDSVWTGRGEAVDGSG